MAGKSTYIRQVALLTLLAHCGCWVPAKRMRLGLVDRIFTRVGAGDEGSDLAPVITGIDGEGSARAISGDISAESATLTGDMSAANGTFEGDLEVDGHATFPGRAGGYPPALPQTRTYGDYIFMESWGLITSRLINDNVGIAPLMPSKHSP